MSNPYALGNDGMSANHVNPNDFRPGWIFLVCVVAALIHWLFS